jgi:hypothetical protein
VLIKLFKRQIRVLGFIFFEAQMRDPKNGKGYKDIKNTAQNSGIEICPSGKYAVGNSLNNNVCYISENNGNAIYDSQRSRAPCAAFIYRINKCRKANGIYGYIENVIYKI